MENKKIDTEIKFDSGDIEMVIWSLNLLKKNYGLDGLKIYFESPEDYCIKGIANGNVMKRARKVSNESHKSWDRKQDEKNNIR